MRGNLLAAALQRRFAVGTHYTGGRSYTLGSGGGDEETNLCAPVLSSS